MNPQQLKLEPESKANQTIFVNEGDEPFYVVDAESIENNDSCDENIYFLSNENRQNN